MKTTEVFVEQMIIGGLIMLTGYILFPVEVHGWLLRFQSTFAQISIGALLTGSAYLIGTVYDRFTDTIFQDLEKHCRLSYALEGIKSESELENDPYPETIYRMAVLSNDTAAQREDYFRRRLRLTRAFATLIPGITAAVILYLSTCYTNEHWYVLKTAMIPLAYLLAFLYKNLNWKFLKKRRPPRTDDEENVRKYWNKQFKKKEEEKEEEEEEKEEKEKKEKKEKKLWRFIFSVKNYWENLYKKKKQEKEKKGEEKGERKNWQLLRCIFTDIACLILLFTLLCLGGIQIFRSGYYKDIIIVILTGIIMAGIVTWSWWRIYHTYFAFVKDYYISIKGDEIKMKSSFSLSAELRWFINEDIPVEVKKWFNASKLKKESKERTDTYLIYPKVKTCGVKFRNNKFEIKTLVEDLGLQEYSPNVKGHAGIWEKWSTKDELIKTFKQKVAEGEADWIAVKKKRVTRKFSVDKTSIKEVDDPQRNLDNGCNVELTKIEIDKKKYWSLAFDSFSEKDDLSEVKDNLKRTVDKLLSESDCPFTSKDASLLKLLSKEKSYSYPGFLAQFKK